MGDDKQFDKERKLRRYQVWSVSDGVDVRPDPQGPLVYYSDVEALLSATLPILSAKPPCGWQAWGQLVNDWLNEHGDIAHMRAADLWDRIVEMKTRYVRVLPDIEGANATHNDEPPCSERG